VIGGSSYGSELVGQLQELRESVLWKLEGLPEHDLRRPMTPTGTNLLGLVKHLAGCEFGWFGLVFGRPAPIELPWLRPGAEENADMWAAPDESREYVVGLYRRSWEHAAGTFEALDLASTGTVPGSDRPVTLRQAILHMIVETARHAGHVDIVREHIDGFAGRGPGNDNLPHTDAARWRAHVERVQAAADLFL